MHKETVIVCLQKTNPWTPETKCNNTKNSDLIILLTESTTSFFDKIKTTDYFHSTKRALNILGTSETREQYSFVWSEIVSVSIPNLSGWGSKASSSKNFLIYGPFIGIF